MILKISKNHFLLLWICFLLKSAYAADEATQSTEDHPRIQCKTIHSFRQVLGTLIERKREVEPKDLMLLIDWDQTIVKKDNEDETLRESEILDIIEQIKGLGISIMVVTARWNQARPSILYHDIWRVRTERRSKIILSDQSYCKTLNLDLRVDAYDKGIHVKGFTYTGPNKGEVINRVLNHSDFPIHPREFVYVEDKKEHVDKVCEIFGRREEKITILYYPPPGEQ